MTDLVGETITGVDYTEGRPSYTSYTLTMKSGRKFVVSTLMNEVTLGEVVGHTEPAHGAAPAVPGRRRRGG
jgi:hypothetical protein